MFEQQPGKAFFPRLGFHEGHLNVLLGDLEAAPTVLCYGANQLLSISLVATHNILLLPIKTEALA